MKTKDFILPTYVLPYLFERDEEGLTKTELDEIVSFLENNGLENPYFEHSEPYFRWGNDLNNLGGDVVDITFFLNEQKLIELL